MKYLEGTTLRYFSTIDGLSAYLVRAYNQFRFISEYEKNTNRQTTETEKVFVLTKTERKKTTNEFFYAK